MSATTSATATPETSAVVVPSSTHSPSFPPSTSAMPASAGDDCKPVALSLSPSSIAKPPASLVDLAADSRASVKVELATATHTSSSVPLALDIQLVTSHRGIVGQSTATATTTTTATATATTTTPAATTAATGATLNNSTAAAATSNTNSRMPFLQAIPTAPHTAVPSAWPPAFPAQSAWKLPGEGGGMMMPPSPGQLPGMPPQSAAAGHMMDWPYNAWFSPIGQNTSAAAAGPASHMQNPFFLAQYQQMLASAAAMQQQQQHQAWMAAMAAHQHAFGAPQWGNMGLPAPNMGAVPPSSAAAAAKDSNSNRFGETSTTNSSAAPTPHSLLSPGATPQPLISPGASSNSSGGGGSVRSAIIPVPSRAPPSFIGKTESARETENSTTAAAAGSDSASSHTTNSALKSMISASPSGGAVSPANRSAFSKRTGGGSSTGTPTRIHLAQGLGGGASDGGSAMQRGGDDDEDYEDEYDEEDEDQMDEVLDDDDEDYEDGLPADYHHNKARRRQQQQQQQQQQSTYSPGGSNMAGAGGVPFSPSGHHLPKLPPLTPGGGGVTSTGQQIATPAEVLSLLEQSRAGRSYVCDTCHATFATRFSLRRHNLKKHLGERPHECTYPGCGRRFGEMSTLKRHLRCHSGDKPFKCSFPGCTRAFADRTNVRRHRATHDRIGPYVCPHPNCQREFVRRGFLVKHLEAKHNTLGNRGRSDSVSPPTTPARATSVPFQQQQQQQSTSRLGQVVAAVAIMDSPQRSGPPPPPPPRSPPSATVAPASHGGSAPSAAPSVVPTPTNDAALLALANAAQ